MEENLKIAKEKAKAANQAKTEFLENMRHDLRTPLTGIVGCAQIIQLEGNKSEKIAGFAHDLVQSSEALLTFLNKVESITVTSGKIPVLKKKFNLRETLEQIVQLNQSQATVKNVGLSLDYDETIPAYVIGDPTRAQPILLELLTNALKFTDQGQIKVTVCLVKNESGRIVIQLCVNDTSMGIPLNQQTEVYTRFKRLTPSYQGVYPGTGLGLSLVKQFAEELGGGIYLESQPHQGTTFTCLIPFQEALNQDAFGVKVAAVTNAGKIKKTAPSSTHVDPFPTNKPEISTFPAKPRILVVEDQAIAANVAQQILSNLPCQVDIASNGASTLEWLQQVNYDLILMDIGLPDTDGVTLTHLIRKNKVGVPIIGLTAHIDIEHKQRCLATGMKAVFTKPLTVAMASYLLEAFIPHRSILSHSDRLPASTTVDTVPILDIAHTIELLGGEETAREAFSLLIRGLDEDLVELKQQHPASDWPAIQALAHKWRGGALYSGARRLEQVCQQVTECRSSVSPSERQALYQQLLQTMEATKVAAIAYQAY